MIEPAGSLTVCSSVALAPAEDGYWAYDLQTSKLHHLNPLAALILELSDGSRTAAEIAAAVAPFLADNQTEGCLEWMKTAVTNGILKSVTPSSAPQPTSSAEVFAAAATQLHNNGYVLAAYVCWNQATTLAPENAGHWYQLAETAYELGKRDEARVGYEKYVEIHGPDAEVEHILIALRNEPAPPRASDRCIQEMYAGFSRTYETVMLKDLGYQGHIRMTEVLDAELGPVHDLRILDAGCGTGIAGKELRPRAADLTGIDLSPEMVAIAQATGLYDKLEVAEVITWLSSSDTKFDLIASCDCFIYFGDLAQLLIPAARRLVPGGHIVFTVEKGEKAPFRLTDSGRYEHSKEHIEDAAKKAGLTVRRISEGFLRTEYDVRVQCLIGLLRKD